MHVGVGSGNPVKREAVESVVNAETVALGATVESVPVPSGVSEQPRGHAETMTGARNRAEAVLAEEYDLGVGIEGGVAAYQDGLFLVMWAVVDDGERVGRGAGPSIELPERIAERVRAGEELGPVMDDVIGEDDVARNQGAAGVLTGGRVDRTEALATAVAGAFGPFVTDQYD